MSSYQEIQNLLDRLVGGRAIGAHGAFWRNLTRDEFVNFRVFGYPLVVLRDSSQSNLIKALKGVAPFGSDTGASGGIFRRMPAGMTEASTEQIDFIAAWIDDGCPDESITVVRHNAFWRDFDNWAMFQASQSVNAAIGEFMPHVPVWFEFCKGQATALDWEGALDSTAQEAALRLLSQKQIETLELHYGVPLDSPKVIESFALFGRGELPDDPLRPQDPKHQMNGPSMWFIWSAFADICIRRDIDKSFWLTHAKAVLVGLLNDGLFRGRFSVLQFTPDEAGKVDIENTVSSLQDADILSELATRYRDSGIG